MAALSPEDKKYFRSKFITISMPTYNEEKNINVVVTDALKVLRSITNKYEVLVINDGSTDRTGEILDSLAKKDKHLRVIHLKKNKGIGNANNIIYKKSKGDILFWNASDNQIHMDEIYVMLPYIKDHEIVVGHRLDRADTTIRKLLSRIFSKVLELRFGLPVKDIDSVKIFRIKIFKTINPSSKTAFIETEILIKAKQKGMRIIEVPIKHYPRTSGKARGINLKIIIPQLWQVLKAIFNIW